jgi:RNA polymerase sigma-70 factor, ECF subfamily
MGTVAKQGLVQRPDTDLESEDLVLVAACANGDIAAFETLVARYDRKLLRIALRITDNLEDAQEAVQEALLKAYQKIRQFQGNSKFSTWLIRITMNECLMRLRKRNRGAQEVSVDDVEGPKATPLDFADWKPNQNNCIVAWSFTKSFVKR